MKNLLAIVFCLISALACLAQKAPDRQQYASLGDFKLTSGQMIQDCRIGYRTYGRLNAAKNNGILFPSWFGGTAEDIENTVPWLAIDTTKFYLILADALGDGVSSSPSNSVKQHGAAFPQFTVSDMVESEYQVLTKKLGIQHVHAVMGISMGGIQTFQWGVSYAAFMDCLIPIVGSPRPSSYDLMGYNIFRKIIEDDAAFNHGNYKVNPVIPTANMLIELSITTPANKVKTMSRDSFAVWLKKVETARSRDWNDRYYQMKAILVHDISRNYHGSMQEAANHIKAKMLIITSQQDHLVNPIPAIEFSKLLPAKLLVLNTEDGHVAPNFSDTAMQKAIVDELK